MIEIFQYESRNDSMLGTHFHESYPKIVKDILLNLLLNIFGNLFYIVSRRSFFSLAIINFMSIGSM